MLSVTPAAFALDPLRAVTQYTHRIWQAHQGLPQGAIYCVYQTRYGRLWLGTKTGLVRFDGVKFTVLRELDGVSLENVWVRDMTDDAKHQLWIATDGDGLIRLSAGTCTRISTKDGLPSDNIHCVEIDRQENLWIGTDRGVARMVGDRIEPSVGGETLAQCKINAICQTPDGKIWIAADKGRLFTGGAEGFTPVTLESLPPTARISSLAVSADGSLMLGTNAGLIRLHDGQEQRFTTDDGLASNQIFCLVEGKDDTLWIGTGDGFSRLRGDQLQSFGTRNGLSQSTVCAICEDHEGSLWVGTKLGLNQFIDRRMVPFTRSEGLPSNNTGPIAQDMQGNVWVGTLDAGLARFNGTGFSTITVDDSLPSNTVHSLGPGQDGSLWVGTDRGLCQLQDQVVSRVLTVADGLPSDRIQALQCDGQGTLWIGTSAGLVTWRDGKLAHPATGIEGSEHQSIVCLASNGPDAIIAAVNSGPLLQFINGQLRPLELHGATLPNIRAIYRDGDVLYLGTLGDGLYMVDSERTVHVSVREGLYDDELYGIVGDRHGQLWFACSKGIFSAFKDSLRGYALGKADSVRSMSLSPFDALRTIECQKDVQPAVWLMQDGQVWISMIRGALVAEPIWQQALPPTSVVIEEVVINGKTENPRELQSIPPGNANLTFRYAALSYFSPLRIMFRYQLEGFDQEWVEADSRREAFYTNIPPGQYRFVVAAVNVDGKTYEAAEPISLTIPPHFYQRAWFWPLCGAATVLLAWLTYRSRVRRIRQRMNTILIERSRIARELHDGLMQGFSGITMQMQALTNRLPQDSAQRASMAEIIGDAGHCLREARQSIAGLRGAKAGLAAAIGQSAQQLTQTQDVRLRLRLTPIDHQLSAETEYNLLRIAQEAITNAIKHSGGRVVDVALENTGGEIRLIVRDDGRGFVDREGELMSLGHYGLVGMRERARLIGADFSLLSQPGRGTTVSVALPPNFSPAEQSA